VIAQTTRHAQNLGGEVPGIARIGLDNGAWLAFEAVDDYEGGPVPAGRAAEALRDLPGTLGAAVKPIVEASQELVHEFRTASPDKVTVEFGVKLTVSAGAVLTKGEAEGHLKVTLSWSSSPSSSESNTEPAE